MIGERGRARALYIKGRRGFNDRQHGRPDGALGPHRRHRSSIRSATDARVILADEPTGNLDSAHGAELMDLLRSIVDREHRTLVLVHARRERRDARRPPGTAARWQSGVARASATESREDRSCDLCL